MKGVFSTAVLALAVLASLAMSGCSNKAAEEHKTKALWESSKNPPPGYIEQQMAKKAASENAGKKP